MIGLHRDLAPMSERVWERVEAEAREVLHLHLAARRLMDFEGPLGWDHSAIDLGRVEPLEGVGISGSLVRRRVVRPLIELRVPFELDREELERIDRGASSVHGGVVVSVRGGDFKLVCGRDAAIGYLDHDEKRIRLHLEESFSAELNGPDAVVPLLSRDSA